MVNSFSAIPEVSVETLAHHLSSADTPLQLLDVREPAEWEIAHLEGFQNLPLSQFQQWSGQIQQRLDPHCETLVQDF